MVKFKEKFSYGLGDASANIFMGMTMMFLTIYYTNVFKLDPTTMAFLFGITRIFDAVNDPLIGMFADKTKHKNGRYRPWLKWFAIPYGVSMIAVFYTPDLAEFWKTVYAYVTYISLQLTFSLVIVPYVSLLGAISNDHDERISINAMRFALAKSGVFLCSMAVPAVIVLFDNDVLAYRTVMIGLGILCTIMVYLCYKNTEERYTYDQTGITFWQQLKALGKNDQALIIFGGQIFNMIMNTLKLGALPYFVLYALGEGQGSVGLLTTLFAVVGILSPFMTNYLLKNRIIGRLALIFWSQFIGGLILIVGGAFLSESFLLVAIVFLLSTMGVELIVPVVWATIPDLADYGYVKDKAHVGGLIGGGLLFSTKAGMAIGGMLLGLILAYYNYDPDLAIDSTADQIFGFKLLFFYLPGLAMVISAGFFKFYKLDEATSDEYKRKLYSKE